MIDYTLVEPKINAELSKDFSGGIQQYVRIGEKKWLYPEKYLEEAENFRNFQTRPSDIWVIGYPRSGTTVTQTLCWLLENNLDFKTATEEHNDIRVPFFEMNAVSSLGENLIKNGMDENQAKQFREMAAATLELLKKKENPRIVKTHLPFCLGPSNMLTSGCKVIYLARYVKDAIVSLYHLQSGLTGQAFLGNFEKFWSYFEKDLIYFTPYWEHIRQGWEQKDNENVLFVFYEDIRKDLRGFIKTIAKFLNRDLSKDELDALEEYLQIDNFKKNPSVNYPFGLLQKGTFFIRSGKVGGWKDYFSQELNAKADKWILENVNRINFKYPESVVDK